MAGALVLAAGGCIYGLWLWDARRRYRRMAALAGDIDRMLHSGRVFPMSQYREGELSLLENELSKLLRKLQEQAEQLRKDKCALADSMADISHQLRTRLTTIHLALTALGAEDCPAAEQTARRMEIRRQLDGMDWLVSSLLKLSRLDAGTITFHPQTVSLEALVLRAAEALQISMELKGQELRTVLSGSAVCDPAWTAEALGNLLKNCTEHMGAGILTVTSEENALYSEIKIRDSGSGIDPEDLPHLFQRFYRGKNAAMDSVGIGLALSRSIFAAQNGTVKAENHPGGGAEFTVRFYKMTI